MALRRDLYGEMWHIPLAEQPFFDCRQLVAVVLLHLVDRRRGYKGHRVVLGRPSLRYWLGLTKVVKGLKCRSWEMGEVDSGQGTVAMDTVG